MELGGVVKRLVQDVWRIASDAVFESAHGREGAMSKITGFVNVTLDGVMQAPGRPDIVVTYQPAEAAPGHLRVPVDRGESISGQR
jgi:hypothetical protein